MKPIGPTNEETKRRLEQELEAQKQRFLAASRKGLEALREDLSIPTWVRTHPLESAIAILFGGYVLARTVRSRRQAAEYRGAQEFA